MGKQGSSKSPRPEKPNGDLAFGLKDFQFRHSEMQKGGGETFKGRRNSGGEYQWNRAALFHSLKNDSVKFGACKGGGYGGKRHTIWLRKHVSSIVLTMGLMGFLFVLDSIMVSIFDPSLLHNSSAPRKSVVIKV